MPYRKKKFTRRRPQRRPTRRPVRKTYARKRTYKRKPKQGVRSTTIRTMGIPDITRQRFLYSENNYEFALSTTGNFLTMQMHLNDPWDPYGGVFGKAALHWQEVMSRYKYCRTYAAKITIRLSDHPTNHNIPMIFAFVLSSTADDLVPSNTDDILSWPASRRKLMRLYPNRIGSTRTMSMYVNIADVFQFPHNTYDTILPGTAFDNVNSGSIASPSNFAICRIYYAKVFDDVTVATSCYGDVSIKYYCRFHARLAFGEPGTGHDEPEPLMESLDDDEHILEEANKIHEETVAYLANR